MRRSTHKVTAKVFKKPIFFRNPYRSIGVTQRASHVMVGPMRREGITSLENEERARYSRHMAQLANAGMLKKMQESGVIPDDMGVDMSDFSSNIAALPEGVANLNDMEKESDIARQIERYNAGILDEEHRKQKALMRLAKKRKQSEYTQKVIQWLAETDELDEVPREFAEEVEKYYHDNGGDDKKAEVQRRRKARRDREEEKERDLLFKQTYWQSNPMSAVLQPRMGTSTRFTTNTGLINPYESNAMGGGWRAPRLHKLVRPLKRFEIKETPDKIVEEQKQALDDRRTLYKDEQTEQRGVAPPKDMVERAMPKLAEPILALRPIPQVFTRPDYKITPHPFVFPKKKYMVHTGVF